MKKTVQTMVRISDEKLAEEIQEYAKKESLAFSTAIRSLAKKGLEAVKEKK